MILLTNILFDFDGTLADTSEGIIQSMHHAYDCLGYERIKDEEIKAIIGPPLKDMFRQLLPGASQATIELGVKYFRERYSKFGVEEAELYPGVKEGLRKLREEGKKIYIVTSKPEAFVETIAKENNIWGLFHGVTGGGLKGNSKSKPIRMGELMKKHNMTQENTVMVGDRHEDVEAAKANGIRCFGVAYGYDTVDSLRRSGCSKIVKSFSNLCDAVLSNNAAGTVYWVTGLAGAGKTTIGTLLYKKIRQYKPNVFRLDGDIGRWAYNDTTDFSYEARKECAFRHARVCKMIADQGIDVVCCTISMFSDVRKWNREEISNYVEIFLDVPMEVLKKRNQKNLYQNVEQGKEKNVAGLDLQVELPENPDICLINDGSDAPEKVVEELWKRLIR